MAEHYLEYANRDLAATLRLVEDYRFGMICVNGEQRPLIAYAPLLVRDIGGRPHLEWHLARNNPVFPCLAAQEVTISLLGPDAPISPSWYKEKFPPGQRKPVMAPTWNYVMAEFYGRPSLLSAQVLREHLHTLTDTMESSVEGGIKFDELPASYVDRLLPLIGVFRMPADRFQCRVKLSQDLGAGDRQGVIEGLERRGSPNDRAVAMLMRSLKL